MLLIIHIILIKGAPIPPEPAVDHWKPDIYVRFIFILII